MLFSFFRTIVVARASLGLAMPFPGHHRATILALSMIVTGIFFCASEFCLAQSTADETHAVDGGMLDAQTRALIKTHCGSCHGGEVKEGGINFDVHHSIEEARENIEVWLKVRQVLNSQ